MSARFGHAPDSTARKTQFAFRKVQPDGQLQRGGTGHGAADGHRNATNGTHGHCSGKPFGQGFDVFDHVPCAKIANQFRKASAWTGGI